MRYVAAGIGMFIRDKSLWRYAWRPMLLSAFVYLAIAALGFAVFVPFVRGAIESAGAQGEGWARFIRDTAGLVAAILYVIVLWVFSGMIYIMICSLFSAFMWDRLCEEVEEKLGIFEKPQPIGCGILLADSLVRFIVAMFIAAFGFATGWMCMGITAIVSTGWMCLLDFTAPAYLRRGKPFWDQHREVYKLKGWPFFILCTGMLTLLPFINLILLPAMVAGGTMLRAQRRPSLHQR